MPLLVGQRINGDGSRRTRRLLLAGDYDAIVAIGEAQLRVGADALDVCVAIRGVDGEAERMAAVVGRLAPLRVPLVIDSRDPHVLATAVEALPHGHAILNSVHLQQGDASVEDTARLALRHGAAIVGLCLDEAGMARTVDHKLRVARRLFEVVVGRCGVPAASLYIDPLVFALPSRDSSWASSALETLHGLQRIKAALPEARTIAGISDVSFGLPPSARVMLNATFLHHCTEAGLDAAIVEPTDVRPYEELPVAERTLADAVLLNRAPDAMQRFADAFP